MRRRRRQSRPRRSHAGLERKVEGVGSLLVSRPLGAGEDLVLGAVGDGRELVVARGRDQSLALLIAQEACKDTHTLYSRDELRGSFLPLTIEEACA